MKYIVTVGIISRREKEITVYARDESEAEEKACDIVSKWDGVDDVDPIAVEEAE